jgi:5,5'-dehydrodivanillate O-demethylase
MSAHQQQTSEPLELLPQTSAGTPMGTLLRSFWQPVAVAADLERGSAKPLRVMGEDLTLYRGESGKTYLVGGRCAHRRVVLHTGWVEKEQIRCMYHGWKYDGTGQCTEMPAEKRAKPELVKIDGYPTHEYAGLVFAYMGAGPAPEFQLPRKGFLEEPGRLSFVRLQVWDCNWFQQIENSLDSSHLSFVHVWGQMSRFGEEVTTRIPDLEFFETSAGVRQVATRGKNNVRISNWTFPNNNHILSPGPTKTDPWIDTSVWAVPMDDERTWRFTVSTCPSTDPETDARITADRMIDFNPADHHDDLFYRRVIPDRGPSLLLTTQDYVAVRGQGVIVDRSKERLAQSDAGIAMLRRIFLRELAAIRQGKPTKRWLKLEQDPQMPIQVPDADPEYAGKDFVPPSTV